jgi:hypothetical protein
MVGLRCSLEGELDRHMGENKKLDYAFIASYSSGELLSNIDI